MLPVATAVSSIMDASSNDGLSTLRADTSDACNVSRSAADSRSFAASLLTKSRLRDRLLERLLVSLRPGDAGVLMPDVVVGCVNRTPRPRKTDSPTL